MNETTQEEVLPQENAEKDNVKTLPAPPRPVRQETGKFFSDPFVAALLTYLKARPYSEVINLVMMIETTGPSTMTHFDTPNK